MLKNNLRSVGRISYLDALKCLGILLVIEGHVWYFGMGIETYDSLSGVMLYSFNMPIFFFVSGFLAYKAIRPSISEFLRRVWQKFVDKFTAIQEFTDFNNSVIGRQCSLWQWIKDVKNCDCLFYYNKDDNKPFWSILRKKLLRF